VANRDPPHLGPKIGIPQDQLGWDNAVLEDLLLVIEIIE